MGTAGVISSPYPMFDHLLELSQLDNSNKWSKKGFGEDKETWLRPIRLAVIDLVTSKTTGVIYMS